MLVIVALLWLLHTLEFFVSMESTSVALSFIYKENPALFSSREGGHGHDHGYDLGGIVVVVGTQVLVENSINMTIVINKIIHVIVVGRSTRNQNGLKV